MVHTALPSQHQNEGAALQMPIRGSLQCSVPCSSLDSQNSAFVGRHIVACKQSKLRGRHMQNEIDLEFQNEKFFWA